MKSFQEPWGIFRLELAKPKINPRPQYQRTAVWSESRKQLLIDSLLRGYDLPKFYIRSLESDDYEYEVVDGQQRMRAIWEFLENDYTLPEISSDLPLGNLAGKRFEELTSEQQNVFKSQSLAFTIIQSATEEEIRELFLRLQEGISLNPAEKRNAISGGMRDFISATSGHGIFPITTVPNRRFEYDDYLAHVVRLELAGGPVDLNAEALRRMYEDEKNFNPEGKVAKKVRKVLNYLQKAFGEPTPELKIKWGFVDAYWLASTLIDNFDMSNRHEDLKAFYLGFENERRHPDVMEDPASLIEGTHTEWDKDLFNYIEAFRREGNKRQNVEIRSKVYARRFHNQYTDLVPKDKRRAFSEDERIVIWRRASQACEQCGTAVSLEEMHADHVKPHKAGGITSIENGQCLCGPCNQSKGAS